MSKLTKYEKETIVLFNEGEDTAHIQTYNAGLKNRLAAFSKTLKSMSTGKDLRARRRVLYSGQVPTVHTSATTVQRGMQTKSKRERQAKRYSQSGGIM